MIEHAFILEEGTHLTVQSLPESFLLATGVELNAPNLNVNNFDEPGEPDADDLQENETNENRSDEIVTISGESLDFNKHKEAFEREFIIKALKMFKGRINQTALHANIPKKTLLRKIEKYGIVAKDYAETAE